MIHIFPKFTCWLYILQESLEFGNKLLCCLCKTFKYVFVNFQIVYINLIVYLMTLKFLYPFLVKNVFNV